jgi:YidC/Oxa1 family membrane protein insertase
MAVTLNTLIDKPPGVIVGPISAFLGMIFNVIFDFMYMITKNYSLGLSIIFITIITNTLIMPLAIKSQKSMMKMQRIAPEQNAIKKKYEGKNDPELKRKMNQEIQELYTKHKVQPLMGCLPMLLTMPVFFGINFIMRQTFLYVGRIGELYNEISGLIIDAVRENVAEYGVLAWRELQDIIFPLLPNKMEFDVSSATDMSRAVSKFAEGHWEQIEGLISNPETVAQLNALLAQRESLETFFGLSMVNVSGWGWPGIIIPILSAVTTLVSMLITQMTNTTADEQQKKQQRMMSIGMTAFIFYITTQFAIGVGIYWVTSNIYRMIQHYILTKYYANKEL